MVGLVISPHPLNNVEKQIYYQNEPRFNDVFKVKIHLKQRIDIRNKF